MFVELVDGVKKLFYSIGGNCFFDLYHTFGIIIINIGGISRNMMFRQYGIRSVIVPIEKINDKIE